MIREDGDNSKPKACPECGSELAAERLNFNGAPVTIVVCKGHPDCDYFYWISAEERTSRLDFDALSKWAIRQSLEVLRRSRPKKRYAPLRHLLADPGGGGSG